MPYPVFQCREDVRSHCSSNPAVDFMNDFDQTGHLTLHERSVTHATDPDSTVELPNDLKGAYMKALEVLYSVIHCREHVQSHCSSNPTVDF